MKLYNSTVRPIIEYGCILYDNFSLLLSARIENLQRRAAIICTGAMPRTETKKLLEDLGWSTLKERRQNLKLSFFYKIIHSKTAEYLRIDLDKLRVNPNKRQTRQSDEFGIPFCRTIKYKNSFFPSTIISWNKLPASVRTADSLSKFKKYLNKKFLYDQTIDYNLISVPGVKCVTQLRLGT